MFCEPELITLKKNFLYITFRVSDLRCDSILWNSIWQLKNFEVCLPINGLPILIGYCVFVKIIMRKHGKVFFSNANTLAKRNVLRLHAKSANRKQHVVLFFFLTILSSSSTKSVIHIL